MQAACREKGWPLDTSTLYTEVTNIVNVNEISEKPEFGCYITGLYLEGATWDINTCMLKQQMPKVILI